MEALFNAGELTDSTGKKITDMSNIKFDDTSDPLAKGLSSLTDSINALIKLLGGDVPSAAKTAAASIADTLGKVKVPTIDVHYRLATDDGNGGPSFASDGGRVTATGVQHFDGGGRVLPFIRRGSDTVPAMLTPGEIVLNAAQQASIGQLLAQGSAGGADTPIQITIPITLAGDVLETYVISTTRRAIAAGKIPVPTRAVSRRVGA